MHTLVVAAAVALIFSVHAVVGVLHLIVSAADIAAAPPVAAAAAAAYTAAAAAADVAADTNTTMSRCHSGVGHGQHSY